VALVSDTAKEQARANVRLVRDAFGGCARIWAPLHTIACDTNDTQINASWRLEKYEGPPRPHGSNGFFSAIAR